MSSKAQIAANRRNALKSTGPKTTAGKLRSRGNALRHGLTAETTVRVLENEAVYQDFEADIVRSFCPQSAVDRELVSRLASVLWRLRRATAIETGLMQIQGEILTERMQSSLHQRCGSSGGTADVYRVFGLVADRNAAHSDHLKTADRGKLESKPVEARDICNAARVFLRLTNLMPDKFHVLGRYESRLWRQAAQLLLLLRTGGRSQ